MIEKDGIIFEGEKQLLKFADKLKDISKDKTIPILTVDGQLQEVLYRDKLENKVYENCGVSSELINEVDHTISIKSR